jgi:hypothetical protein
MGQPDTLARLPVATVSNSAAETLASMQLPSDVLRGLGHVVGLTSTATAIVCSSFAPTSIVPPTMRANAVAAL